MLWPPVLGLIVQERALLGTTPHVSTLCLPDVTTRVTKSPGLPLHICRLQAIEYWRWEQPGNEAIRWEDELLSMHAHEFLLLFAGR